MATPEANISDNGDTQKEKESAEENFEDPDKHHSASNDGGKEELLQKLNNHFKDPYTRICNGRGLGRVPEKLILLMFVWVLCTYQLVLFGNDRAQFADFLERNSIAMKHLLLKDWSPDYETMPYPPSTGVYAIYTIDNLLEHINYTVTNVYNIPTTSVGSFFIRRINGTGGKEKPVTLCLHYFETGIYNEAKEKIAAINTTRKTDCRDIDKQSPPGYGFQPSIADLMRSTDGKLVRLLSVNIQFKLSSIHLNAETGKAVQCFGIHGTVFFDNRKIDGQITVKLKTNVEEVKCNTDSTRNAKTHDIVISALVLLFCVLHGLFCLQGWITSAILFKKTKDYYNDLTGKILSTRACWEIFKLNDLILFLSHSITIVGSVIKISIDQGLQTKYIISMYDATGILLGLGCLFTWISVLHYLAYDHVFGLIFSVMEKSAFVVIKFLACVSILFAGFVLCAWAVVGPYHIKFASLTSTFQSLLALVNGDEIYVTFTAVDSDKEIVWFFNGFFLVVFLALFTLITLNIFIAIFNTAYEHQHDNEYKKDHRSDLLKFLGRMESKTFDTTTCASCVRHTCPSMLGCASFCDEDRYNRKSYQFNT
ncbi:mucolipin-3-like isoform X2 [Mytilus californianus]|uniref:mucolipin-3-like isoform X2 n=1 Tax=Mytilus californianus TaxID=6549 RepID=UPI0022474BB2|nr:mucolipin-3-like isoform X2 [Mytilus californianus]XP_052067095.1 mucolipin-3-like isoform X2 [Mytilus californianus]